MSESEPTTKYPGIDRLQYFLGNVGMILVVIVALKVFGPDSRVMEFLNLPIMVATLILDVMRLRNIGLSQWFAFVRFIPFGSSILAILLLSAQSGWAESRRWDSAGRSILIFTVSLFALVLFVFLYSAAWESTSYWDLLFF